MDKSKGWLVAAVAAASLAGAAAGQDPAGDTWLTAVGAAERQGAPLPAPAQVQGGAHAEAAPPEAAPPGEQDWAKPVPLSFGLDYTLVSDYVWRGINLSEYPGEGREKPNHQINVSFSLDTKDLLGKGMSFGKFGGSVWFEWFAGQERLTGWSDSNLQEVDYAAWWSCELAKIGTTVELGWIAYTLPRLSDRGSPVPAELSWTHEAYVKLSFDDSVLFGKPVLSPYVAYYQDLDDVRAGWMEVGVSHDFALGELGCKDVCILKDVTVSPSLVLGIDHRYYDKAGYGSGSSVATRLGNLLYGLCVSYDLAAALKLPPQAGTLSLKGTLYYSQAFHDVSPLVDDWLFGGVTVSYGW